MHKVLIQSGAILGAIAVALGAFGAHALKTVLTDYGHSIYETAVRYQFYHVFGIIAAGLVYAYAPSKSVAWSGFLFIAGIIIFSGSLYTLALLDSQHPGQYRWLGAITPIGGVAFIAGWLLLAFGSSKAI